SGVNRAAPQTKRLASGVQQTGVGASRVKKTTKRASNGSRKLKQAIAELATSLAKENSSSDVKLNGPLDRAQSAVQSALRHLGSASPQAAADPNFQRAKQEIQNALAELGPLKTNLTNYTTELDTNATASREISHATRRLTNGLAQLAV